MEKEGAQIAAEGAVKMGDLWRERMFSILTAEVLALWLLALCRQSMQFTCARGACTMRDLCWEGDAQHLPKETPGAMGDP